jgi:hypothetical protein
VISDDIKPFSFERGQPMLRVGIDGARPLISENAVDGETTVSPLEVAQDRIDSLRQAMSEIRPEDVERYEALIPQSLVLIEGRTTGHETVSKRKVTDGKNWLYLPRFETREMELWATLERGGIDQTLIEVPTRHVVGGLGEIDPLLDLTPPRSTKITNLEHNVHVLVEAIASQLQPHTATASLGAQNLQVVVDACLLSGDGIIKKTWEAFSKTQTAEELSLQDYAKLLVQHHNSEETYKAQTQGKVRAQSLAHAQDVVATHSNALNGAILLEWALRAQRTLSDTETLPHPHTPMLGFMAYALKQRHDEARDLTTISVTHIKDKLLSRNGPSLARLPAEDAEQLKHDSPARASVLKSLFGVNYDAARIERILDICLKTPGSYLVWTVFKQAESDSRRSAVSVRQVRAELPRRLYLGVVIPEEGGTESMIADNPTPKHALYLLSGVRGLRDHQTPTAWEAMINVDRTSAARAVGALALVHAAGNDKFINDFADVTPIERAAMIDQKFADRVRDANYVRSPRQRKTTSQRARSV